jgi:hypothetical protein
MKLFMSSYWNIEALKNMEIKKKEEVEIKPRFVKYESIEEFFKNELSFKYESSDDSSYIAGLSIFNFHIL